MELKGRERRRGEGGERVSHQRGHGGECGTFGWTVSPNEHSRSLTRPTDAQILMLSWHAFAVIGEEIPPSGESVLGWGGGKGKTSISWPETRLAAGGHRLDEDPNCFAPRLA